MSDSVRPHRQQPARLPRPWDSPGKSNGVGCHFLLQCMKVKNESEVAQSCLTLCDPMDRAYQAPASIAFPATWWYCSLQSASKFLCCLSHDSLPFVFVNRERERNWGGGGKGRRKQNREERNHLHSIAFTSSWL